MTRKRVIWIVAIVAVFAFVAFGDLQWVRERWARRSIERVEFVTAVARGQLREPPTADPTPFEGSGAASSGDAITTPTYDIIEYDAVPAIGNDCDLVNADRHCAVCADVSLPWLVPTEPVATSGGSFALRTAVPFRESPEG